MKICIASHSRARRLVLNATAALLMAALAQAQTERNVVASPADITSGLLRLPAPSSTPSSSSASVLPVRFEEQPDGRFAADFELPVEAEGRWSIALLSPAAANWRVLATPRGGVLRSIDESFALQRTVELAGDDLPGWVVVRRDLRGAPAGEWRVRIEAERASDVAEGWLFTRASNELVSEAWVTTHELVRGKPIAVAARATGRELGYVRAARLVVETTGVTHVLAMRDDGAHDDGAAADGLFGAWLPRELTGPLSARAELRGVTREGLPFLRTAQLAFSVSEPALELAGVANATHVDATTWRIELSAAPLAATPPRVLVAAEVWSATPAGPAPLCWLARIQTPRVDGALWTLALDFDERWIDLAGAAGPLELRHVRVQDPDSLNVLARIGSAAVHSRQLAARATQNSNTNISTGTSANTTANALLASLGTPVGPFPSIDEVPIRPALMLVHGYCSGGSIWPAAHFTEPKLEFLDPSANRTHDQFAQLIAQSAASAQLSSFGVVAHSQGGPASLQLLTFYTTGLDVSSGERRIQSVAAPYQGTPLASFGFLACGNNANLTPAGSSTWLAGIPSWARAQVFTWTTSNSGSACYGLVDFILANPEDGTVEKTRGELPSGNNMGHITGWCHTTGMSNPANYTDAARNALMNTNAAR